MPDIFLSYATQDRAFVNKVRCVLQQQKYSTWMDQHQINAGDDWVDEIVSNLRRCKVFIVFVTDHSNKSCWVQRECLLAEIHRKPRIPVLRNGEMPFPLLELHYVDFRENQQTWHCSIRCLLEALKHRLPIIRNSNKPAVATNRNVFMHTTVSSDDDTLLVPDIENGCILNTNGIASARASLEAKLLLLEETETALALKRASLEAKLLQVVKAEATLDNTKAGADGTVEGTVEIGTGSPVA